MALVQKQVAVEDKIDDLMSQINNVVGLLKSGTSVTAILLAELLKLQTIVTDIQATPGDFKDSFSGSLNAATLGAVQLVTTLLGKS